MATAVQVLCPNGRRQNVKVTPNTKFLQILEEVCIKQNFLPVEDFNLIHGRTTIDLSLAFRFSNLPNMVKLELVRAQQSRLQSEDRVTIALQLESGERLQHTFPPSTSLWEIIHPNSPSESVQTSVDNSHEPRLHPVCIYMREEVVGEMALKHCTLKKLALTTGKAVIRLVHRPVEDSAITEINYKIEQEIARKASMAAKVKNYQPEAFPQPSCSDGKKPEQDTSMVKDPNPNESPVLVEEDMPEDRLQDPPHKPFLDKQETETPHNGGKGTPYHAEGSSHQEVTGPKNLQETIPSAAKLLLTMNIPGAEVFTGGEFNHLSPDEQLCDREELIYNSNEDDSSGSPREDVGEDFFELTEADIRSLFKNLQQQASSERPLMTEAMRAAKMEEKHKYYDFVVLRVQFPDGLVLQGCFGPRETVSAVYKFVREHLEDKQQEFYLYVSPPRHILSDMEKTLVQMQLAPASVVYFGSSISPEHSLAGSDIMNIVSRRRADEVSTRRLAKKQMEAHHNMSGEVAWQTEQRGGAGGVPVHDRMQTVGSRAVAASNTEAKVPKWLKLGKK